MSDLEIQLEAKEQELNGLKISFNEYVDSSRELEAELEASLEDTQHLNKSLSIQKVKAEQHVKDLTVKLEEYHKSLSRLQGTLNTRDINIVSLEASKRDLEQLHEAGEEKLRQVEFAESQACEQRDEAEESYVLLLCELEELRLEKQASEDRLKAELMELQAEIAELLSPSTTPKCSPTISKSLTPKPDDKQNQCDRNSTTASDTLLNTTTIEDDRFPMFHMTILAMAVLSSAIALTTLFPYIGFMIIDVGVASNINEAGYYSGAIASAMMFGRFASSFLWGQFADHFGRKPPLLIGCFCITTMSVMFGMSTSLWMMIVSRVLLGLFNPIWGIAKTLVSELCSRKYEARAMGLTASCWSLGVVVGPVIGGFLANPGKLYPQVFTENNAETFMLVRLLIDYPYLLPNLVVGMFSGVAGCLVYWCLPETLAEHPSPALGGAAVTKRGASVRELLHAPGVSFALTAYFVLSFIDLSFSEIIPLWAIASVAAGGLGMEQQRIGFLMTFTGCLQVAYTMVFYPIIVEYWGRIQSFRKGQMLFIPFCLGITVLNEFPSDSLSQFVLLVLMFAIARACCSLGNSSIGLIVNRCVQKEQRASINGLSMGIGSMAKAIGPMVSTYLFAWSINPADDSPRHPTRRIFPLDCHAIFIIFAILSVVCICLPLVYYETDEEMMRAREEQKAALYQCQSEKSSRDERDANMSLLQHHDNSNSSHHNSKTYGSISQV